MFNAYARYITYTKKYGENSESSTYEIGQLTLENNFLERALIKAGLLSAKR
jgi:hypothetical protein